VESMGLVVFLVGVVIQCAGGIWIIILMMREGHGFLYIFYVPWSGLAFVIRHWRIARRPFGLVFLGSGILILGAFVMRGLG